LSSTIPPKGQQVI
jgi:hypothetical protein